MNNDEVRIYRYNDKISFRQCNLANKINNLDFGDCTNFYTQEENWKTHYYCHQYGIHLHCTTHPSIELENIVLTSSVCQLRCPKCNEHIIINSFDELLKDCLKALNMEKFKNANLIRLDDWYIPEIKEKVKLDSDYWINVNVKTDKDKDTIIVLYIGKKNSSEKAQFFIKPEKLQLTSDHKDLDPKTILSKIEVTLKDRTLEQKYD